jgi:hemoglobin
MEPNRLLLPLSLVVSLSFEACGAQRPPPPVEPKVEVAAADAGPQPGAVGPTGRTLYDRLGGKEGMEAIGDTFLKNLLADPRVGDFFKNSKGGLSRFKQQLCQLSGGPCHYGGKDMKNAHSGMGISDLQFDAFLEDFKRALDDKRVSQRDESEILAALAPMRTDIVEKNGKK